MKTRNNLSQFSCNTTFKTILRSGNESRKDVLIAPVEEFNKSKYNMRKEARSTDNLDQFNNEKDKLNRKYQKLYGNSYSAFRTTINSTNEPKRNGSLRRDQIQSINSEKVPEIKPIHQMKMKEFYKANPIETYNKRNINNFNLEQIEKNKVRCDKVSDYLGSKGVKSIFNSDNNVLRHQTADKITNKGDALIFIHKKETNKNEFKKFRYHFEGKKGIFLK